MRIIKRTKITVIRTETVYLQRHDTNTIAEILALQANSTKEIKQGTVIEIEAIRKTEDRDKGEIK